jgi:hypothetical protein
LFLRVTHGLGKAKVSRYRAAKNGPLTGPGPPGLFSSGSPTTNPFG